MDSWIIIAGYGLVAVVGIFLVGILLFGLWVVVTWGLRVRRRLTRKHLYVLVIAKVNRAFYDPLASTARGTLGQIWVTYEHKEKVIQNRLSVSVLEARRAETSGTIALKIDPDYPHDVMLA